MSKTSAEIMKEYVRSQNFTSTDEIMAAIKDMFKDVLQEVTRLQRELEKYNLLRRKYQGKGRPAKLYVLPIPKTRIRSP